MIILVHYKRKFSTIDEVYLLIRFKFLDFFFLYISSSNEKEKKESRLLFMEINDDSLHALNHFLLLISAYYIIKTKVSRLLSERN